MAENVDGGLAFKSTLDNVDYFKNAAALENRIRASSNVAINEAGKMDGAFSSFSNNASKYITGALVAGGMAALGKSIITTRGEFQQLEIAFTTMLGSATKSAQLMGEAITLAAKTPFDLKSVAAGAKQLLAYGGNAGSVMKELEMLGNIASGVSAPLNDIVYLYGTLRAQGRAYTIDIRQFASRGIPIYAELAKVLKVNTGEVGALVEAGKVGFPQVEQAFKNMTGNGGMFFNLMAEQSKSLTGMLSNLSDAWDMMLNKAGTQTQGILGEGILTATYLIQHYDEVLRVLGGIAIAYGSVRAAIALNSLAVKGSTGIGIIDNTVKELKIALLKTEAAATGQTAAIKATMTAAEVAHTAALQVNLTVAEQEIILNKVRVAAIEGILTAQQQQYLSNINLTTSSQGYAVAAMEVLSVEQKAALSKMNLTRSGAAYSSVLRTEVAASEAANLAARDKLKIDVKLAEQQMASALEAKASAIAKRDMAQTELTAIQQTGTAKQIERAEIKLNTAALAAENASSTASIAISDASAKKKALNTLATRQSTVASVADTGAKVTQTTVTNFMAVATGRATLAMKTLWTAMKTNPLGWILSIIGLVVSAFTLFGKKQEETATISQEFEAQTQKESSSLKTLIGIINTANQGTKLRKDSIDKLNTMLTEYNISLLKEGDGVQVVAEKYKLLTKAIKESVAQRIYAQELEKINANQSKEVDATTESFQKNILGIKGWSTVKNKSGVGERNYYDTPEWVKQASDGAIFQSIRANVELSIAELNKIPTAAGRLAEENRIKKAIVAQFNIRPEDMSKAMPFIDSYYKSIADKAKEANEKIKTLGEQVARGDKAFNASKTTEAIDYVKLSFSDLDNKLLETQKIINDKEYLKPGYDGKNLFQLQKDLGSINKALVTKTADLNTESGIDSRIKELKVFKESAKIGSKEYTDYVNQITALENKIPKTTKQTDDKLKKAQEAADKQKEADLKLEESRVEIMKEGYDKRLAENKLQHDKAIAAIDKEQSDLERAYKEAGKKMPSTDKAAFDERRANENTTNSTKVNDLFQGEIEFKKKQYELYYKWVNSVGEEAANEQFKGLLKSGASYADYIKTQRDILQSKLDGSGSLTERESTQLVSFNAQYDEITGIKSATDLFKESLALAVEQAGSLGDKLDAIAKKKEELESGKAGIIGADAKGEARLVVNSAQEGVEKEIQNKILVDLKGFEQKKKDIQAEYAALRNNKTVTEGSDLLARINKGESDALSALNTQVLMQSDSWKNLFTNLDALSVSQIEKLIKDIESKMSSANLNLNPVDYKTLIDSLKQAKDRIATLNPFKALGDSFNDYRTALADLDKAKKSGKSGEALQPFESKAKEAAARVGKAIGNITQITQEVGGSVAAMFDSFGNDKAADGIGTAVELMGELGKTAGGVAKIMAGDIVGGISDVITGIMNTITIFNKLHDKKNEARIQALAEQVKDLAKAYDALGKSMERAYSTDKANMLKAQSQNLEDQNALIRKQIAEEQAKKKTDNNKIKEWQAQIEENNQTIADNSKYAIVEAIMGSDIKSAIDDFANAYADAWAKGEKAAGKSADVVKNLIRTSIIEMLKSKLKPEVEAFMAYMAEATSDGIITSVEQQKMDDWQKKLEDMADATLAGKEKWLTDATSTAAKADPMTGAIKSVTEETASVLSGRVNLIAINQVDSNVMMRQSLIYEAEIALNTRGIADTNIALAASNELLKKIDAKLGSGTLVSKGII